MNFFQMIAAWWGNANAVTRALVATGILVAGASIFFAVNLSKQDDFAPLFTRVEPSDAAEIIEKLRDRKIEYKLSGGGSVILVPTSQVHELRIDVAAAGLPRGGGVGFEVFDKSPIGMTDFTQRVNYIRALQGELARTVGRMTHVESARVHLAVPENSLFTRHRREPSASVYLKLYAGRTLSSRQVVGVTHLISTAVEGLSAERVAVLDGSGKLLGPPTGDGGSGAATRALSAQHDYEKRMENRLVSLLEHLVGRGNVVAQVSAEMDLSKSEITEETLDPDTTAVRVERKTNESSSQRDREGGIAGTPGNVPPTQEQLAQPTDGGSDSTTARKTTQFEYEIPKTVRRVKSPGGKVTRLSVAVLVDIGASGGLGAAEVTPAAETPKPNPGINPEALAQLVKKAVGYNTERGDEIEVVFVPFARPDEGTAAPQIEQAGIPWLPGAIGGGLALILLGAGTIVTQKKNRALNRIARKEAALARDAEIAALEAERPHKLRIEVKKIAKDNPEATEGLLKDWLAPEVTSKASA